MVGDAVRGQTIWGYINAFAGAVTALLAPFLGAIADKVGRRKPWIGAIVVMMCPAILLLWFAVPGSADVGIATVAIALAIASTGYAFSEVFHNAMLPSVAPYSRIGTLSGVGLALGNSASLLILLFMLYAFALPASGQLDWPWLPDVVMFGLDTGLFEHDRISAPISALWMLVFSLPLFLFTPDQQGTGTPARQAIREGLDDVWQTFRHLRQHKNVATYLVARMFYNDGNSAIMTFGMIYSAGVFGWGGVERILVALLLMIFAVAGGLIGGRLDDAFGSKRAIVVAVFGSCVGVLLAVSITPTTIGFIPFEGLDEPVWGFAYFRTLPELLYVATTILFALFITSASANSRTMLARIAPEGQMTKFFGLYALSGQVTAFIAPLMVAIFTDLFVSQRAGLASILVLLIAGLVMMAWVRESRESQLQEQS